MSVVPNITIQEFHAGKDGLIAFYTIGIEEEVRELELTKHETAKLVSRTGWVDDVDVHNDTVMVKFEVIYEDVNHNGNHVQRLYKMHMEWDEYRSWVGKREVRDIVKLFLKENQTNGNT